VPETGAELSNPGFGTTSEKVTENILEDLSATVFDSA
jgi:hypothetical protein